MNVISQDAFAKIAVNKSLLKEYTSSKYSRVVYLSDGDEFQIQLFNPEQYIIAAKIYLNSEELSDMLVLRPGERIWLERYLDKSRKFKFSTYEVDDSPAAEYAIKHNGEVKVEFYKVKTKKETSPIWINSISTYKSPEPISIYYSSECNCIGDAVCTSAASYSREMTTASASLNGQSSCASTLDDCNTSIETGRVEEGGYSNQKFSYVNYDFDNWPFKTDIIYILPLSRKPITSNDLQKRYCSNCGRKLSPKHKFCPYCGVKID